MEFKINVYDKSGKIVKTCTAKPMELTFGAVRTLMEVLKVDSITNTSDMLKTIFDAWETLRDVLNGCFTEMTDADWEYVRMKELAPVVMSMLRYSFAEMMTIPQEKN